MDPSVALSEVVRNWVIVVAGVVGVGIAMWRAAAADRQSKAQENQARIAREQRHADLYFRALEALGSDELEVRVGSILAIEALAKDNSTLEGAVTLALQAYLRRYETSTTDADGDLDFAEAMRVVSEMLSRRET